MIQTVAIVNELYILFSHLLITILSSFNGIIIIVLLLLLLLPYVF
jgi:hypothetical protein